jgi:hypothetical protein
MNSEYPQSYAMPNYDTNPRPLKRRRRELVPAAPQDSDSAAVIPEEVASQLLQVSNAQILQSIGFSGSTSVAQERMRQLASNCSLLPVCLPALRFLLTGAQTTFLSFKVSLASRRHSAALSLRC